MDGHDKSERKGVAGVFMQTGFFVTSDTMNMNSGCDSRKISISV